MSVWEQFLLPMVIAPSENMKTLMVRLEKLLEGKITPWNITLTEAVVISMVPVLIVFLVFQKHIVKGITMTGIKGNFIIKIAKGAMNRMNILVTGGAGYIGSHIVKSLSETEHKVFVFDNLAKGHREAVIGSEFIHGDLKDKKLLVGIMRNYNIEGVIHLAAYGLVSESMKEPGKYYFNNVCNGLNLLEVMVNNGVKYIVFSSTAAIYGEPDKVPITENHPTKPTNIYGETKLLFEKMLARYNQIYSLNYVSLRYFNAAGADPSVKIGEDHNPETHLIPIICKKFWGNEKGYIFLAIIILLEMVLVFAIISMSMIYPKFTFSL